MTGKNEKKLLRGTITRRKHERTLVTNPVLMVYNAIRLIIESVVHHETTCEIIKQTKGLI
jgi:hypothetical protein